MKRQLILSKAVNEARPSSPIITKRTLSITLFTSFVFSLAGKGYYSDANAAILEADDDEELLEKVKRDRQKRIERQGVISSSNKETGWLPSCFSFFSFLFFFHCVFLEKFNQPTDQIVEMISVSNTFCFFLLVVNLFQIGDCG